VSRTLTESQGVSTLSTKTYSKNTTVAEAGQARQPGMHFLMLTHQLHAHGRGDAGQFSGAGELAALHIHSEDTQIIRPLIGNYQPLTAGVEGKVPRKVSPARHKLDEAQPARGRGDCEYGDAVVTTIRSEEKPTAWVDVNIRTV